MQHDDITGKPIGMGWDELIEGGHEHQPHTPATAKPETTVGRAPRRR
jgi:hypothetical protein